MGTDWERERREDAVRDESEVDRDRVRYDDDRVRYEDDRDDDRVRYVDDDSDDRVRYVDDDADVRRTGVADERVAGAASQPADVDATGVRVHRTDRDDVGIRTAHERFGGIDLPATLVGMLTALSLVVLLSGLVAAAIGAVGYQTGVEDQAEELTIAGLIGGLVVLFLSFLFGGWAAGRIARYDGVRNGLMTAVWAIVLAALLSGLAAWLGDEYDVFRNVDLPQFFSRDALTAGAIASAVAAVAAMLLGGALGGAWGERYHRRADAAIAAARSGGIDRTGAVTRERP